MKSKIKYLTIGVIVGILFTSTIPAIAENVEVLFNSVGLKVNGEQISQIGESYTLQNGNTVPYTISYKDTTYLPIRKIGEIFGVDINYDDSTKNVIVGKDVNENSKNDTNTAANSITYEEFYSMWTIKEHDPGVIPSIVVFHANYKNNLLEEDFINIWDNLSNETFNEYSTKMLKEYISLFTGIDDVSIIYMYGKKAIAYVGYDYDNGVVQSGKDNIRN